MILMHMQAALIEPPRHGGKLGKDQQPSDATSRASDVGRRERCTNNGRIHDSRLFNHSFHLRQLQFPWQFLVSDIMSSRGAAS